METRANFVLIGAFTLAAVVGVFLFIMWIAGYGSTGTHRRFQVVFIGSVAGLSNGANVLFNGIKVGEVTHLTFSKSDPHQVVADIDVTADAPIDRNTSARLETQGLTGAAAVALIGGAKVGRELTGENGQPPVIYAQPSTSLQDILDSVQGLSGRANSLLDQANSILADNSGEIHSTIDNLNVFSKALSDNASGVDSALKGLADLGKTIQPLATRLQSLSDDADRLVKAIDTDKVRTIVGNLESLSGKADSVLGQADKLLAENAEDVRTTMSSVSAFSKTLNANSANVDAALKGFGDFGKRIEPLGQHLQAMSEDADKVIKAIDPEKVRSLVDNAQTFSQALSASSGDYRTVMRNGATLVTQLNDTSKQLGEAIAAAEGVLKAVDPHKVSGIVDSISDVATTVRENRGNIDATIKNATELTAKLNESADKVDGLMTSLQGFVGAPGTKGALAQVSEAAQSIKKLADDVDVRVKEISVGLNRFSSSGLRQYEALAVQGQRVLDDIDRTVRSFERNPSQIIWGAKPSLPEYRGGQ
jgi:phospholipid/cholesterol/gamma-HCH transport system substrate-binding protein